MTAPMGWSCWSCGQPFEHGRQLVDHLRAEHPEEPGHLVPERPVSWSWFDFTPKARWGW